MKKGFIISALLILALTVLLLGGACAPKEEAPAGAITLKFATFMPPFHYIMEKQFPGYIEMVEAATNGKYKLDIEWYPGGSLISPVDMYDGIVNGIADIGQSAPDYTPGRFPVISTLMVSGIAPQANCSAGAHMAWAFYKKYKPEEFDDAKVLYLYGVGPGWLHSKTPIRSVADLEGLKMRVPGSVVAGTKALGGEPIGMSMGEVYEAVEKGLVDVLVGPPETLRGWEFQELFDYSAVAPGLYFGIQAIVMNLDTWESLPGDLQDAFEDVADDAVAEAGRIWEYYQQDGLDYASSSPGGHTIIELPAAEVAKMNELFKPVVAEYIAELNSKGLPGEELVEEANKIAEKYNKLTYETWEP